MRNKEAVKDVTDFSVLNCNDYHEIDKKTTDQLFKIICNVSQNCFKSYLHTVPLCM